MASIVATTGMQLTAGFHEVGAAVAVLSDAVQLTELTISTAAISTPNFRARRSVIIATSI